MSIENSLSSLVNILIISKELLFEICNLLGVK